MVIKEEIKKRKSLSRKKYYEKNRDSISAKRKLSYQNKEEKERQDSTMAVKVKMIPVESSNADSVGYDSKKKELFVMFRGGAVYKYSKVPKVIFEGLKETESFGRYLNNRVKGAYSFVKVS